MRRALAAALALVLMGGPALAQSQVKVSADTFVLEENQKEAVFTGNVTVTHPDVTVEAQKVVVTYGEGGMQSIESFVATGAVQIKTADQNATGKQAVYDPKTQKLTLSGDVVVVNASGRLTGPSLVVDLKNKTSVFQGGGNGQRVIGVFN